MSGRPRTARIYRALLGLYPRAFRAQYRDDMVLLFEDQCGDEPSWRVCGRSLIDLALTIPNQHLEAHMKRNRAAALTAVYVVVAVGGVALAVGTDMLPLQLSMAIALVAGVLAVATLHRNAPYRERSLTGRWWQLLLAGVVLIVGEIVAAELGVDIWWLAGLTILLAFGLIATGLLLGVAHLFSRLFRRRSPSPA